MWGEQDTNEVKTSFRKKCITIQKWTAFEKHNSCRKYKMIYLLTGVVRLKIVQLRLCAKKDIYNFCLVCSLMRLAWSIFVTDVGFYCMLSVLFDTCPLWAMANFTWWIFNYFVLSWTDKLNVYKKWCALKLFVVQSDRMTEWPIDLQSFLLQNILKFEMIAFKMNVCLNDQQIVV